MKLPYYLMALLFLSCVARRPLAQEKPPSTQFDGQRLTHVYNYVINHMVDNEYQMDVYPITSMSVHPKNSYIAVTSTEMSEEAEEYWQRMSAMDIADSLFFKQNALHSDILKTILSRVRIKTTPTPYEEYEAVLSDENCIMFVQFSDVYRVEDTYLVCALYTKRLAGIDDTYGRLAIFEFEVCEENGLISFQRLLEPMGRFEGKYTSLKKNIATFECGID